VFSPSQVTARRLTHYFPNVFARHVLIIWQVVIIFYMKQHLGLPAERDGDIRRYVRGALQRMRFHRHEELEVNLVLHGQAGYLLGGRRYELQRHSLVWFFPDQDHMILDVSPDYEMWVVVFKPEMLRRVCTSVETQVLLENDPPGHFCRYLLPAAADELHGLISSLHNIHLDTARLNAGLGYAALLAWALYQDASTVRAGADVHPCVAKAARLLRDETESLSLPDLAHQVGLNEARLSRLFQEQTGISIVDFRNRQRVDRFIRLYGQGHRLSMAEAAREAGFGSYPQFHRVFKELMGYGPAEHRRKISA
jgi:AraC-like DNA-binding protein